MARIRRGDCLRRALAIVVGVGIAAAVFFLRRAGLLLGVPALVFTVVVVLLLPLSRVLSRRILLAGALFLGWIPLLWWVKLPVPAVDRTGIVLALITGGLAFWLLWAPGIRERVRRLVPQVAVVDAMPFVAGGIATWTFWPLFNIPGAARLLALLTDGAGWDHCQHTAMVLMTRLNGVMQFTMGTSPDGSAWRLRGYSQYPHGAATSVIELGVGPSVGDISTEVIRYGHGIALMLILVVVLLAAGIAQLPGLRRHPFVAWPVGAMTVAAFLFGLGSLSMSRAWWNWTVTCAGVGLAVLLAGSMTEEWKPLKVLALGGLVVATVHGWLLVAPLAVVGAGWALLPFNRGRWPQTRGGRARMITVLGVTGVLSIAVVPMVIWAGGLNFLTGGSATQDLLSGRFTRLASIILTGGAALAVALAAFVRARDRETSTSAMGLAAVPAVAFLSLAALGAYQVVVLGTVAYYFDKLVMGTSLVCVPVIAAGISLNLGPSASSGLGRLRKSAAVLASALAAVAALHVFGFAGLDYRLRANEIFSVPSPAGERMLEAAELADSRPFNKSVYLAALPDDPRAGLAYYYQLSLDATWTDATNATTHVLHDADASDGDMYDGLDVNGAYLAAIRLLEGDPELSVIVAPEIVDEVRELLPSELRSRVITWDAP